MEIGLLGGFGKGDVVDLSLHQIPSLCSLDKISSASLAVIPDYARVPTGGVSQYLAG
jgi:hypothetical protein